jgi:DNA ligase-1
VAFENLRGSTLFRANVSMMLAERLPNAAAIIKKIGRCGIESKIDGFRCQVHVIGSRVEILSRNLERTTSMFPDIADAVRKHLRAQDAVIKGEAVAINESTGEFYPFQITAQRKRKREIEEMAEEFPLTLNVLRSSCLEESGTVQKKYTCDGMDISIPLEWSDPPEGTKSFALVADDPDAPSGTWVH